MIDTKLELSQENIIKILEESKGRSLYSYMVEMKVKNMPYELYELTPLAIFQLTYKEDMGVKNIVSQINCSENEYRKYREQFHMNGLTTTSIMMKGFSIYDDYAEVKILNALDGTNSKQRIDTLLKELSLENFSEQVKREEKITLYELEQIFNEFYTENEPHNSSSISALDKMIRQGGARSFYQELLKRLNMEERLQAREEQIKDERTNSTLTFSFQIHPELNDYIYGQAQEDLIEALLAQISNVFNNFELNAMYADIIEENIYKFMNEFDGEGNNMLILEFPATGICLEHDLHGEISFEVKELWYYNDNEEDSSPYLEHDYFKINTYYDLKNTYDLPREYSEEDLADIREMFESDPTINEEEIEEMMESYKYVTKHKTHEPENM